MVAMDTGFISLLIHPDAKPPSDPATNQPVDRARERIEKLVDDLNGSKDRVVIPTPVLSEFLVLAGEDGQQYLSEITNQPGFYIRPFDEMAAVELAAMELLAKRKGNKRMPLDPSTAWQKVKLDRQIVAIAKTHQCHTIYADDGDVRTLAEDSGIKVISSWELPLPKSNNSAFR